MVDPSWGSLGAQNNDGQSGSNTVDWQANFSGSPGAKNNAGQWWSIPVEDHSARKTMTANQVQTQLIDRRFPQVLQARKTMLANNSRSQLRITRRVKQWQLMRFKHSWLTGDFPRFTRREKPCWPMIVDPSCGSSARKTMTANEVQSDFWLSWQRIFEVLVPPVVRSKTMKTMVHNLDVDRRTSQSLQWIKSFLTNSVQTPQNFVAFPAAQPPMEYYSPVRQDNSAHNMSHDMNTPIYGQVVHHGTTYYTADPSAQGVNYH